VALNFPSSPTIGDVYTDTTSGFSYEWDGTVWKSYTPSSAVNIKVLDDISGSFNGSTQTFPLTISGVSLTPVNAQQLRIVLGGVVQSPGTDYNISGTNIVFTTAPDAALEFSGVSLGPSLPVTYANDGVIYVRNTYTATSGQTLFTFAQGYTVGYLDVYRNGVRLSSGTDFTATNGSTFTLTVGATSGDEIEAIGYSVASLVYTNSLFTNINVTGIGTINTLNVNGAADLTQLNVTGIGTINTLNVNGAADLTQLNVTGVSTLGIVTGATYYGDGSNLTGVISGVGIATESGLVGSGATILDFRGAGISTVTVSSGIATVNIEGGGGGINPINYIVF
jgi:hypothetical protein